MAIELSARQKRLRYRAWHRGTREMDLVLGPFADAFVAGLDGPELDRLERLMDEEDTDLHDWIIGQVPAPPRIDPALISSLIAFKTKGTAAQ